MATKTTTALTDKFKTAEIAKIHIAKQQLGLDDATYRDILSKIGNCNSSKDLTPIGRAKLLEYFKKNGFKTQTNKKTKAQKHPGLPTSIETTPQLKKIEALLTVSKKPWSYALAIAKQMYKKDRLEFCTPVELTGIISALQKMVDKLEAADAT